MHDFEEDYYEILGVEASVGPDEIRKAYLKLAKRLHPDRFPNDDEAKKKAQSEFARVTRAHDILGDGKRRAEYDSFRRLAMTKSSRHQDPIVAAEASGESKSRWAEQHYQRADDYLKANNIKEAEVAIKEAIRLSPGEARLHNKLAQVYMAKGWKTYALAALQVSLNLDPSSVETRELEAKIKKAQESKAAQAKAQPKSQSFLDTIKEMLTKKM